MNVIAQFSDFDKLINKETFSYIKKIQTILNIISFFHAWYNSFEYLFLF